MTLMDSASRKGLSFLFLSRRLPRQGGSSSCQKQQSHPSPLIHFRAGPVPSTPAYIRVLSKGDGSPLRLKEVSSSSSSCSYSFLLRSSLIERKPSSHFPTISLAPSSRFFTSAASGGGERVVEVPSMGDSITEGTLNEWKKNVGDYVQEGDLLAVIDTDKVSVDVTAPISGRLVKFEAKEGETIEVGKPLYIIDPSASPPPPGEKSSSASSSSPPPPPPTRAPAAPPPSSSSPTPPPFPPPTSTPASVSPSSPSAPGSGSPQSQGGGILSSSSSSSFLGRGVKPSTKAEGENVLTAAPDHSGEKRVPMSRMRLRIAERLKNAQNTAAMLTTFNECDMGSLMALRTEFNEAFQQRHGVKLGFVSAFMLASTLAMKKLPVINSYIDGRDIVYKNHIDISVAVATPKGLVVPVIRGCEQKTWPDIEKELAALATKARNNQIALEDMAGGTFTVSNGGVYGSMMGTPILNPPQASILGMHGITKRAVVKNDQIVVRPMMYLALTYDHRLIDGREAVTFLRMIRDYIEEPRSMLLDL